MMESGFRQRLRRGVLVDSNVLLDIAAIAGPVVEAIRYNDGSLGQSSQHAFAM
jgi:hypothetical protein